jgi:hypothetical protein
VAFSHPDLFVVEPGNADGLRQVDVESGTVVAQHPLPEGVKVRTGGPDGWQVWVAAANRDTFAWVVDDVLRTVSRDTWESSGSMRVPSALEYERGSVIIGGRTMPSRPRLGGELTAGNRLIVYSAKVELEDEINVRSVIYDPRSGQSFETVGQAYAAGDWLLWQDGDTFRLGRVR